MSMPSSNESAYQPCPSVEPTASAPEHESDAMLENRRKLLKKIAKYGAYTAPAFLAIFASQQRAYGY